jgi:hemolysin III
MVEAHWSVWGIRDPLSSATHFVGFLLAVAGTLYLWLRCRDNRPRQLALACFGLTMITLYLASATYHAVQLPPERLRFYQLLDHSAIYGLIAGSYTPALCVLLRNRPRKYLLLAGIWTLAVAGIVCKWLLPAAPYWLTVNLYFLLGWIGLLGCIEMFWAVGFRAMLWAFYGGILYTLGGVCDMVRWPSLVPGVFDSHELFHIFCMGGTFCHFLFMVRYVIPYTAPRLAMDEPLPEAAAAGVLVFVENPAN